MPSRSEAERQSLLRLARESVIEAVSSKRLPNRKTHKGLLAERGRGVFVTLYIRQMLRGCIGVVEGDEPIGDGLIRCAASAALQDSRFAPVHQEELACLRIEVSLLSKPQPITLEGIEIGRHGLLVTCGNKRGVLLPQVAQERQMTPEQFLAETCRKAVLEPEAWRRPDVEIYGFTCEIFSEAPDEAEKEAP